MYKSSMNYILLIIPFVFFGCNKEITERSNESASLDNRSLYDSGYESVEQIGIWHNQMMDRISLESDFESMALTDLSEFVVSATNDEMGYPIIEAADIDTENLFAESSLIELALDMDFSATGVEKVEAFQEMMFDFYREEEFNITSFNTTINSFEAEIIETEISDNETYFILGATTIARYSTEYWEEASSNEGHVWHDVILEDDVNIAEGGITPEVREIANERIDVVYAAFPIPLRTWQDIMGFAKSWRDTETEFGDDWDTRLIIGRAAGAIASGNMPIA